jgi:hypothetical protein
MPIRSRKNQYRGVNAHLHSRLQAQGDWESFHGNYITFLGAALNQALPPGYVARTERSIQIREFHPDSGEEILLKKKPDVAIYTHHPPMDAPVLAPELTPSFFFTVEETLPPDPDAYLRTIVIHQLLSDQTLGRAITQIEILSPTNKSADKGYLQYIYKREAILKSDVNLVEVDYLPEGASPLENIPSYRHRDPNAFPYTIAISIPRPSLKEGPVWVYGFSVDSPIPTLEIPLAEPQTIKVDFASVYNQTFESFQFGYNIDYEQLPDRFETYSPADQERIRQRMKAIQKAHAQGINLDENAPLPLEERTP